MQTSSKQTLSTRKSEIFHILLATAIILFVAFIVMQPAFAANNNKTVKEIINQFINILKPLFLIAALFIALMGGFKLFEAHTQNNGPKQQEAIGWIIAAIGIMIFSLVGIDLIKNLIIDKITITDAKGSIGIPLIHTFLH